jgi:hypothetical protein
MARERLAIERDLKVRPATLIGVLIFALCALIRIGLVDRHSLWADEFFSLAIATGHSLEHPADRADAAFGDYSEAPEGVSPAAYSQYLKHDVPPASPWRVVRAVFLSDTNPPLYYLLLNGWTRALGTGDVALRLFSVLCSLACVPGIWALAHRLGGRAAAISSTLLFAVSPLSVFYSTEGRMYSLLLLSSVCMIWMTLDLWDKRLSAARFTLWVTTGVVGLLTHYFFVFVWISAVFWLLLHPDRFPRKRFGPAILLVVLLVLPWYYHIPESLSLWRVTGDWQKVQPSGYRPVQAALLLPWSFLSIDGVWGGSRSRGWINAGLFLILAIIAYWKFVGSLFSGPRSLLWFWVLSPCIGVVAFDLVRGTYATAVPRYALAGMPAAFLIAGVVLGSLESRVRAAFLALILLLCLTSIGYFYLGEVRSWQNYRGVAKMLVRQVDQSDLILIHSIPSGVTGLARYLEQEGASDTGVSIASWVGQLGNRRVPEDIEALAANRRRIILVKTHDVGAPAPEQSWLEENAELRETKQIYETTLLYFTSR